MKAKILTFDLETAPNLAYVWGAWKQNVSLTQTVGKGYLLSFAAKWLHSDEIIYEENRTDNDKDLVQKMIDLMDEADIVVAHNGNKFDIPTVNARAAVHGIDPPSPYKSVDTLAVAKRYFRFTQNTLAYLTNAFGVTEKLKHKKFPGWELWVECLKHNDEAWKEMKEYNIQDVISLEELYLRMRPWISNHPNIGVFDELEVPVCPKCGGKHVHYRGYYNTNVGKYRKFQCQDCKGWGRTRFTEYPRHLSRKLITNAA